MPTYIDVHVLQTVPPSNLNRDDAGSPKQAVYGGARRARVSSQSWKRATRKLLADAVPETDRATRTKRLSTILATRLGERFSLDDEVAQRVANALVVASEISIGKKEGETAYLLFFGRNQVDAIVDAVAERIPELIGLDTKALEVAVKGDVAVKEQLMRGHPLDVALFGRMVADIPSMNVDAATQVAHAISTHKVDLEFDYYTAVDDEKRDDEDAGVGMIGTIEFNSATLYRYATLGLDQLIANLGVDEDEVADGVVRFVDAFVRSMPTGHQNSFAHRTLPSLVVVSVRHDQPVNLVSAFEAPVGSTAGTMADSADRLAAEMRSVEEQWVDVASARFATYHPGLAGKVSGVLGESQPFPAVLEGVRAAVGEQLQPVVA